MACIPSAQLGDPVAYHLLNACNFHSLQTISRCAAFRFFLFCTFNASLLPFNRPEIPQLTDLTFVDVSDTTIGLRWTPLNFSAITGYRITVIAAGETVPIFEDFLSASTGYYTVHGLEPGIDYDISVITLIEGGGNVATTRKQQTGEFLS